MLSFFGRRSPQALLALLLAPALVSAQGEMDKTTIVVRLPKDAVLKIGGRLMTQTGEERTFQTPDLAVGKRYSYEVEAFWQEKGKDVRQVRTVRFKAGDTVTVSFFEPPPADEKKKETKKAEEKNAEEKKTEAVANGPKSRTFELTYAAKVKGLDGKTKVWAPVASSSDDQDVKLISSEIAGEKAVPVLINTEKRYGNRIAFGEVQPTKGGEVMLKFVYRVTRREVKGETGLKFKDDAERIQRFLKPDALVPIDGKPVELIKDKKLPDDKMKLAKELYDIVDEHMKYSKVGVGWGRGDAAWACDSKYGNCSDFHSLFISLARAKKVPAKFEIGFSIPVKRGAGEIGGYHCWAFFKPDDSKGWVPVDISEANKDPKMKDYYFGNLTEDRVTFSTGRDIDLTPEQSGRALNFFLKPYAEVDEKEVPEKNIELKVSYKDVK